MVRSPLAAIKPPFLAFQAHPSDLELVNSYLRPWVETGAKTGAFIHDADVYAADPAHLTRQFPPAMAHDGERAWYFYTPLRHKSVHGKRKTRTVATGGGCWHNEAKSKPVYMVTDADGKRQIGHRQSFSFVKKDTGVRVRTGWLMVELRLLKDGAAGPKPEEEEGALGNRVICKVYRSPRNPVPSASEAEAAAAHGWDKAEAAAADDDDESSDATLDDDVVDADDSSDASLAAASGPKKKPDDVESSEATVAAPSRHGQASYEISGGAEASPGRKEKAEVDEGSAETSAAAPSRKRKAVDDESSGAAPPPALKKKAGGSSTAPGAPVSTAEVQCPQCGTHLALTLKKAESKSETEIAKDASGATPRGETRGPPQKNVRFHQFM